MQGQPDDHYGINDVLWGCEETEREKITHVYTQYTHTQTEVQL